MSDIDISVIVATYNQRNYIKTTLDSILAQQFSGSIEVLVGDDCSEDGTGAIVQEYGKKYPDIIKPVVRTKNLGSYKNIKDLLYRSKGKYIALIEGDDYWINENKLQEQFDFMEAHPDYSATFGKSIIVDENGNRHEEIEQYVIFADEGEYTIADYQEYNLPGQTASSFYRRDSLEKVAKVVSAIKQGRILVFFALSDIMLVLSILSTGRINKCGEYYSAYRYILNTESNSWSSKHDYFSFKNESIFLLTLYELEKIAKYVKLPLDFDDRRKYEFAVIADKKGQLNIVYIMLLRLLVFLTSKSKRSFIRFIINRKRQYS